MLCHRQCHGVARPVRGPGDRVLQRDDARRVGAALTYGMLVGGARYSKMR